MAHGKLVLIKNYIAWGKGRRGFVAPVDISVYKNVIKAFGEYDRFTQVQMRNALTKEFPRHYFRFSYQGEDIKAQADRWVGDGIEIEEESSDQDS